MGRHFSRNCFPFIVFRRCTKSGRMRRSPPPFAVSLFGEGVFSPVRLLPGRSISFPPFFFFEYADAFSRDADRPFRLLSLFFLARPGMCCLVFRSFLLFFIGCPWTTSGHIFLACFFGRVFEQSLVSLVFPLILASFLARLVQISSRRSFSRSAASL